MSVPFVKFNVSQQGGPVRPGTNGIAAIIAASASGPLNTPSGFNDYNVAIPTFGAGPLCRYAAQLQEIAENPFVLVRANASTAATYSAITESSSPGTSAITAGSTVPNDDYNILVTFTEGGTEGAAGILFTYSLNPSDPDATSAVQALGTSATLTIPGTGASLHLGAGTVVTGQTAAFTTKGARMNSDDLAAALTALQRTSQPWEAVYPFGESDATVFAAVSSMLTAKAAQGSNQRSAVITFRPRAQDGSETEAQYNTAFAAAFSAVADQRIVVAADAAENFDPILNTDQVFESGIFVLARGMAIDIGTDPALQGDGPLGADITIDDDNGNPVYHDELKDPGLDDNRAATLRSWDQYTGVYINNANVMAAVGSPYFIWPQWRVMGRGLDIVYQTLVPRLGLGVRRDQTSGFILEVDAAEIDGLCTTAVSNELLTSTPQRCSGVTFKLSRNDNLSGKNPVATGQLKMSFLIYVKGFLITATVVETVTVNG